MSLRRTSKGLNSYPSFLPSSPLRQYLDKNQNLDKQVNSNVNKEFLPKKSSPKSSQKILSEKSSQKNPHKKTLPKNSSKKIPPKNSSKKSLRKIPWKLQKNSIKIPKIYKQFLKKFVRFWKCPIPYIALGGRKPFWASFFQK